uniref:Integrase core domain containing protein n=1 Tax=Solanum tuberosum TaxID=4113 RepID=M1DHA8_SOLTU
MQQPYVIVAQLLDGMTSINRLWYTREDQVSPLTFKLTKKQMEKDQERDQNIAKIMTQLDILSKNIWELVLEVSMAVGVGHQGGGYRSNYPRQGGNQGWAIDEGWTDRDREWRDRNPNWKDKEKDRYVPPHERQKPKDLKGGRSEDMLSRIFN